MTASSRCAIYTRKSSDEGLDQAFNSLHAQRELCSAFVQSQAGEGWRLLARVYDDGGYSGASMARPALQRLLADVAARRVDVVVVYKVDRLTRSLSDFARIIEAFDKAGVSFVSVTQSFNTTTSIGRLTLNILLSFAQFERELTGERIRDKIAASKAKGLWMGGLPPLGYDRPKPGAPRILTINDDEARTVRLIFQWFLELGSLIELERRVLAEGVRSKRRVLASGRQIGGCRLTRGALRHILSNRTYMGVIPHGRISHPGRHPALIDPQIFDAVQALMQSRRENRKRRPRKADGQLLSGKVFDADGLPMKPIFGSRRNKTIYSYYVGVPALPRQGDDDAIRRVSSPALDDLVLRRLAPLVGHGAERPDRDTLRSVIARVEVHASRIYIVIRRQALADLHGRRITLDWLRARVKASDRVVIDPAAPDRIRIEAPIRLKLWGGRTFAVPARGEAKVVELRADARAIRRLRRAHQILAAAGLDPPGQQFDLQRMRAPTGLGQATWAFLAPDTQRAILSGRLGVRALERLRRAESLPLCWADQKDLISQSIE